MYIHQHSSTFTNATLNCIRIHRSMSTSTNKRQHPKSIKLDQTPSNSTQTSSTFINIHSHPPKFIQILETCNSFEHICSSNDPAASRGEGSDESRRYGAGPTMLVGIRAPHMRSCCGTAKLGLVCEHVCARACACDTCAPCLSSIDLGVGSSSSFVAITSTLCRHRHESRFVPGWFQKQHQNSRWGRWVMSVNGWATFRQGTRSLFDLAAFGSC